MRFPGRKAEAEWLLREGDHRPEFLPADGNVRWPVFFFIAGQTGLHQPRNHCPWGEDYIIVSMSLDFGGM